MPRVPGRRRALAPRVAAVAAAAALTAGGLQVGGVFTGSDGDTMTRTAAPAGPAAGTRVALSRLVGQRVMSRMQGTMPGPDLLRRVRAGEVGGVILFADNIQTPEQVAQATAALQRSARAGRNPRLLIAVDQEGGRVKRFPTLPPDHAPAELGQGPDAAARSRREGARTADALRRAGVNVDLAPVVDVRHRADSFLGQRAFGTTPSAVRDAACAFARGLKEHRVAPTLKHFPGLGAADANTDLAHVSIDAPPDEIRRDYAPYRACAQLGLVMMNSAVYPRMFGSTPAMLARRAYTRELASTGFTGVTITDDLQAVALAQVRNLAVKVARAGADILLYAGSEAASDAAYRSLMRAARRGALARGPLERSYARILALKSGLGR
jgi:beta-N-acetylhexosaminidase